ncbi:hypothetical protein RCO48_06510 [Peribacillus frigoritolerans]|nr:hypothetical protein [Peribacillus frigoritolerans]
MAGTCNMGEIAMIFRGGCIIRAQFLQKNQGSVRS